MTTESIRKKLSKNGYSITLGMNGTYIAKKDQRQYSATSLNAIYKKIFGKLN
jgi:hypothetical protein